MAIIENQENVDEYIGLLHVIESTGFSQLPSTWCACGERKENHSRSRVGAGADWPYYDPHARLLIGDCRCLPTNRTPSSNVNKDIHLGWITVKLWGKLGSDTSFK